MHMFLLFVAIHSGREAGLISWEAPAILDANGKKKCAVTRERNVLSGQSHASNCSRAAESDARHFDAEYLNWSDSRLLNEVSLTPFRCMYGSQYLLFHTKSSKCIANAYILLEYMVIKHILLDIILSISCDQSMLKLKGSFLLEKNKLFSKLLLQI